MRINKNFSIWIFFLILFIQSFAGPKDKADHQIFTPIDVFELEYASDPQISPDGKQIVYVRNFMDIMKDKKCSNLWIINFAGSGHRPLTTGNNSNYSPRWSPDGSRILFISNETGSSQMHMHWIKTHQQAKITNLTRYPSNISWSQDSKQIAFTMMVEEESKSFISMPAKPKGAKWCKPARVIDKTLYRIDGQGYLKNEFDQIFVIPAIGGTPRQVTYGPYYCYGEPSWSKDNQSLYFYSDRTEDWDNGRWRNDIQKVDINSGSILQLTDHNGGYFNPIVSPDGKTIAYLGYEEKHGFYNVSRLNIMDIHGKYKQIISSNIDRYIQSFMWTGDSKGFLIQYDDLGNSKIVYISLSGKIKEVVENCGNTYLGRPYGIGMSFSISKNNKIVYTEGKGNYPADVAVAKLNSKTGKRLTWLNDDILSHKKLGKVQEIWYKSSFDQRDIHGWVVTPPNFDENEKYPLILEIHGGPIQNYGNRFAVEIQLYVAAGYVVFYANPRGSCSYGEEFVNLIDQNYPGQDYDDLMSGVDVVINKGFIDTTNLFVTGGSAGGVMTAWIVGKNKRFNAAAAIKPIVNNYSNKLTRDFYSYIWDKSEENPWENPDFYLKFSPITYVGNVKTPTMLMTGEQDYRTPISQTEEFYGALQIRGIETVMVRFPETSHSISSRPSRLISKVKHIIKWFEMHKVGKEKAKEK